MGKANKGAISSLYRSLIINASAVFLSLRQKLEAWVGDLEDDEWTLIRMAPREITISAKLRMVQTNVLHLTYVAPIRLNHTGDPVASRCTRCLLHRADFFHMFWTCPAIIHF